MADANKKERVSAIQQGSAENVPWWGNTPKKGAEEETEVRQKDPSEGMTSDGKPDDDRESNGERPDANRPWWAKE